jgi:hypothetical protein
MTDTDLARRLEQLRLANMPPAGTPSSTPGHPIDTALAWREFVRLRTRAQRNRRRGVLAAALAAAAGVAFAVPALAGLKSQGIGPVPGHGTRSASPAATPSAAPHGQAGAVVARIPVSIVGPVVQDGTRAWAIGRAGASGSGRTKTQLIGIDLRTNTVVLRKNLGTAQHSVAAGGGGVWLTTTDGRSQGQIVRLDPRTGHVIATLHLPAGRCYFATYATGSLWAACFDGAAQTAYFRIDASTGQVLGNSGPEPGLTRWAVRWEQGTSRIAVARGALWYITPGSGVSGVVGIVGGRARVLAAVDPTNTVSFGYVNSLVSSQGFVWALTGDESVAKIDPLTGQAVRIYTYRGYDPSYTAGFTMLAVGHGSLWFVDARTGGVISVRMATGQPAGTVPRVASGCNLWACGEIYSTPSAIWVPTRDRLIRINPAA